MLYIVLYFVVFDVEVDFYVDQKTKQKYKKTKTEIIQTHFINLNEKHSSINICMCVQIDY